MITTAPEFHLDFKDNNYESCAAFVSILAYPKDDINQNSRSNLHTSLCNLSLRTRAEMDEKWTNNPQLIKPIYAFRDSKLVDKDVGKLKRRLRDRIIAAKMGMAYLQEVVLGKDFQLPIGMERLSLNELSFHVMKDLGTEDASNIETRIWRASLPVLHIVTAIAVISDHLEINDHSAIHWNHLMIYPELIKEIIRVSHQHADMLLNSNKISINPESLIRIHCI